MLMFANRCILLLMVSVGMSKLGCTHLIFVDPGVKINDCYYREVLLSKQLLPAIRQVSGDFFVFQQDTIHRAWRQSSCCNGRCPHSSHLICGLRIDQISTQDLGSDARTGLPEKKWRMWTSWESDWLRSGPDCNRTWLTMLSTSGTDVCMPAFGLEEDILSICCDCISDLGYGSWSSLKICRFIVKQGTWFRLLLVFLLLTFHKVV